MGSKQELKWFFLVVAIVAFFVAVSEKVQGLQWYLFGGAASLLFSVYLENRYEPSDRKNLLYRIPAGILFLAYVMVLTIIFGEYKYHGRLF